MKNKLVGSDNLLDLNKYSVLIFDLDDTIYDEFEYLKLAYSFAAKRIHEVNSSPSKKRLEKFLISTFLEEGRNNLYQKLEKNFNIKNYSLEIFLDSLRTVPIFENSIPLNKYIYNFISKNFQKFKMFIATNGNPIQQANKFKSLDIPHKDLIQIIYCDSFGKDRRKPSPFFINHILTKYELIKNELLFIGNCQTDQEAALNGGIDYSDISYFINSIEP